MPAGSDYPGPKTALDSYAEVVEAAGETVKGAKNPYTSRNGHMFSFLEPSGGMALRLSDEDGEEFQSSFDSGPVMAYGSVMRGYVSVPGALLENPDDLVPWFQKSHTWIGTLEPKPTKSKKKS